MSEMNVPAWVVRMEKATDETAYMCSGREANTAAREWRRLATENSRLRKALREAATMTEHEESRTLIYNHCLQAMEVSDE